MASPTEREVNGDNFGCLRLIQRAFANQKVSHVQVGMDHAPMLRPIWQRADFA
jgi:hypothetical protein